MRGRRSWLFHLSIRSFLSVPFFAGDTQISHRGYLYIQKPDRAHRAHSCALTGGKGYNQKRKLAGGCDRMFNSAPQGRPRRRSLRVFLCSEACPRSVRAPLTDLSVKGKPPAGGAVRVSRLPSSRRDDPPQGGTAVPAMPGTYAVCVAAPYALFPCGGVF